MNHQIPAVYEEGILRLLEPLDLQEHAELMVTLAMPKTREKTDTARVRVRLEA